MTYSNLLHWRQCQLLPYPPRRSIMSLSVDGITIPDSQLAREITDLVRDTASPLLFHHSSRVYYFGALAGKHRGLKFDPELLYCGCMFHDMGLTHQHSSTCERFEVDGANAARDFLKKHGIMPEKYRYRVDCHCAAYHAGHSSTYAPGHCFGYSRSGNGRAGSDLFRIQRRRTRSRSPRTSAWESLQGRHYPDVLRRHQAQAGYDVR
ncbi:HD domain-containing protein [Caballeronia mineralivorans]|uniref:HD domain-containing protein n=1 Tax=Caballeronia mineralivorans TaxID=2010198 RepID=UPI003A59976B